MWPLCLLLGRTLKRGEEGFTYLAQTSVYCQHEGESEKVESSKEVLCRANVLTPLGDVVEHGIDVHKASWVPASVVIP